MAARREYIQVRVADSALCTYGRCRHCLCSIFGYNGKPDVVECSRADCDNHLRDGEDEIAPTPIHALVKWPEETTQPELPYSPE